MFGHPIRALTLDIGNPNFVSIALTGVMTL
ncbi:protein of unknown function [Pararobbsia alpina]